MLIALWRCAHGDASALPVAVAEGGEGPRLEGSEWSSVAGGLETYRGVLLAKIVLTVLGALALGAAMFSQSQGLAQGAGVLWALVDVGLTLLLIGALAGYCNVPDLTDARQTAVMATASAVLLLAVQVYTLWLLYMVLGHERHLEESLQAQARMPTVETAAQLGGLGGLLLLLVSFRALATYLGLAAVAARTGGVALAVMVTMAGAFSFRWALLHEGIRSPAVLVACALGLLAVAIGTLVSYLGIVAALAREVRMRADFAAPSRIF